MEPVYSAITAHCLQKYNEKRPGRNTQTRILIALAGPPGSGKSTIAAEVVRRVNKKYGAPLALVLPMDGFHLPRKTLDEMPNRLEAYARRGAVWTFDARGVVDLVQRLHRSKENAKLEVICAPGFDHVLKDPFQNAIQIQPHTSIVIIEGNWLLLDEEPWRQISTLVDDTWFVDVDSALARVRLARRHIASGIESDWEAALARAENNDLLNGVEVRTRLVKPNIVVQSIEEHSNPAV